MKRIDYKNCGKLTDSCFNLVSLLLNTTDTSYALKTQRNTCQIRRKVALYDVMILWSRSISKK